MKTVLALFKNLEDADNALFDIEDMGYTKDDVSVIAQEDILTAPTSKTTVDTARGAAIGGIVGLIAGVSAIAIPGVGPVIAAGSILGTTLSGTGLGAITGGIIGFLRDLFGSEYEEDYASLYEEGIKEGNILVAITTTDHEADSVRNLLAQHGGHHIHIHEPSQVRARV